MVNLIVKLHPVQDTNNEYIKKLIHKLEPNILILQTGSIKEIISSCDAMINLHVELMPSTVLLEGLILKKPIMNIVMTNDILEFQYVKDNAVLSVTDNLDLENSIKTIINEVTDGGLDKLMNFLTQTLVGALVNTIIKNFLSKAFLPLLHKIVNKFCHN